MYSLLLFLWHYTDIKERTSWYFGIVMVFCDWRVLTSRGLYETCAFKWFTWTRANIPQESHTTFSTFNVDIEGENSDFMDFLCISLGSEKITSQFYALCTCEIIWVCNSINYCVFLCSNKNLVVIEWNLLYW